MQTNPRAKSTSRDEKAATLLAEGRIRLNLDGTATAFGSGKAQYLITKETGCNCPDRTRRNQPCKHEIGCRALCQLYRAFREQAKETGKARLPWILAKALPQGGATAPAVETPRSCDECGAAIRVGKTCRPCLDKALFGPVAA